MEQSSLTKPLTWGLLALLASFWCVVAAAGERYRPFVVAMIEGKTVPEAVDKVTAGLNAGGLDVVGQYAPYDDDSAVIVGFTSPELQQAAASDEFGGFGGVLRAAVTDNAGAIEVTYVSPEYIGYAYHLGDLSAITAQVEAALGKRKSFGAKGMSEEMLERYHYMMFMPYFKDKRVIARFDDHAAAVQKVAAALQHPDSDMAAVWQVKISDDQTLFGVKLYGGKWEGKIKEIMSKIDLDSPKSTAALPWELLVTGGKLVYLPGKFRIAVMFPDLPMGTFMEIANVPDDMDASARELAELAQ
jgi:hypothetical protein